MAKSPAVCEEPFLQISKSMDSEKGAERQKEEDSSSPLSLLITPDLYHYGVVHTPEWKKKFSFEERRHLPSGTSNQTDLVTLDLQH